MSFNTAPILSHLRGCFSHFSKGEVLSIFCFSVASSVSLAFFCCFSLLGVTVGNKFSGANFLGVEVGLVFFDGVLPRFLFQVVALRSRNCSEEILLMSGLPFLGSFSLFLGFPSSSFLFFFERYSSGSHRAHPSRTFLVCFLCFLSPPHLLSPVLAVRPFFLAFCRGAFLGPVRFGVFVGFSRYFVA